MNNNILGTLIISPLAAIVFAASASVAAPAFAASATTTPTRLGAPVSPLGGCGDTLDPEVNGVKGHWTLDCSGGQITVDGWVEDIQLDGHCVGARGEFASGETERTGTCDGYGSRAYFTWTHPGSLADVYIYEY